MHVTCRESDRDDVFIGTTSLMNSLVQRLQISQGHCMDE